MNSLEITDKKETLKKRCHEIVETAKAEIREMTEEEAKEFEANKAEIISLNEQLEELQKKLAAYEDELPNEEEKAMEDDEKEDELPNEENNTKNNKEDRNISNTMKKEFRLLDAIRNIAYNRNDNVTESVNAKGAEEMRKAGMSANASLILPVGETRDITVANEGEDTVAVDMYDVLEPLRAKNILAQAGAKFLTGLTGDVQIPIMTGGNVNWEGENVTAKDAGTKFESVKLSPKRLTAYLDISRQFLEQTDFSAEALLRQDLINAINSKLEATILGAESGTTTMPEGIFYTTGSTATISDFKGICDAEAAVEDANVMGECKYIVSNKAKAALRAMAKSTKSTELCMEHNEIDGTPVLNSSNVAAKYVAYGDFSNVAICQWGSILVTVDPYTLSRENKIRLVVSAFFDAKVLRPNAIVTRKVA